MLRYLVAFGAMLPLTAHAESYCRTDTGQYGFGQAETTIPMKVVVNSVKRPPTYPGQRRGPWCGVAFRGGQFFKRVEIVTPPAHGRVRTGQYSFRYSGQQMGHDRFVVRVNQMDSRNNEVPILATVDVEVVAEPF